MSLKVVRNDIVKMHTDAIVNTANPDVAIGSGCEISIYNAAGKDQLLEYRRENIGSVPEGEVFITPGFNLEAQYIIHAVSPMYTGGDNGEEEKLRRCYQKSLSLALEYDLHSISFPLISTGSYGYPKEEGMRIAVDEINSFLDNHPNTDMDVYLVVFDTKTTMMGKRIDSELKEYIDYNYVKAVRQEEYGNPYFNSSERFSRPMASAPMPSAPIPPAPIPPAPIPPAPMSSARAGKPAFSIFKKPSRKEDKSSPAFSDQIGNDQASPEWSIPIGYLEDVDRLKARLDERKAHLSDTFSEYLLYLIEQKGKTNAEVYKNAAVDKKLFAKIKNDKNYHPQKITCLCLCVGAELSLDESKDLLARAGYAFSPCDMRDVIFSFFLEKELFDIVELDIQLEEYGLPCVIT